MDEFQEDFDLYDVPAGDAYAANPVPNHSLALMVGANAGDYESVARDISTQGSAYVAAQRAIQERNEEIALLEGAVRVKAQQGDTAAVEEGIRQIQALKQPKETTSYIDNTQTIANAALETLAAQSGKKPEDIIRLAQLHSNNIAIRSALEIMIQSMPERGELAQFAQDVLGATTVEDWFMMSPHVNKWAEANGFDGPRAVTKAGAVENTLALLRQASPEDTPKLLQSLSEVLTKAVGGKDTRRFFEQLTQLTGGSSDMEAVFGALDLTTVAAIAKGGLKAIWRSAKPAKVAMDLGHEKAVVDDIVQKLESNKSVLGVSRAESVDAAVASSLSDLKGTAPKVFQALEERTGKLLEQLREGMYTGGATKEEIEATVRRLETVYAKEANPAVIDAARVTPDYNRGVAQVDVLYGRHNGTLFDSAEEALAYWKTRKAGNLEAVKLNGSEEILSNEIKTLEEKAKKLTVELAKTEKPEEVQKKIDKLTEAKKEVIGDTVGELPKDVTSKVEAIDAEIKTLEAVKVAKEQKAEQLSEAIASLYDKRVKLENSGVDRWAVRQKIDFPVFIDDLQKMSADELDKVHRTLGVANPRLQAAKSLFQGAVTSMYKGTRTRELYKAFIEPSFKDLSAHQLEKVDEALMASDKLKKNLNPVELEALGLASDAEKEAYYAYRTMRDIQWQQKNAEAVKDLMARGNTFVSVKTDEIAFDGPAKKVDLSSMVGRKFYDVENKKFVTVTSENLRELQSRNVLAYEYAQAQSVAGVKSDITRVLAPTNNVVQGDLKQAVGRIDGTYSRVYMEEYWIKLEGKTLVDDELQEFSKAFRTAATERDALKYVEGFKKLQDIRASGKTLTEKEVVEALGGFEKDAEALAKQFNNGDFDGLKVTRNYTRMQDNFIRDVVGTGSSDMSGGRVFWSKRGENAIKSITEGATNAQTLGPLKSLEAELSNTSRFEATNEWRRNSIQKWYNTFQDQLPPSMRNIDPEQAFFRSVNELEGQQLTSKADAQMLATRDFILNQLGVMTAGEKKTRAFITRMTSAVGNFVPVDKVPALGHVGHYIRQANVTEWTKSVSSHLMLGMFNISQLVVQASSLVAATSMSPKHGLKAAMSIRSILVAMTSDNPSVWKKVFKAGDVAKDTGMSVTEFQEVAQAIRKVGLLDNIGASSLWTAEDGALNIYGSQAWGKFNKAQMMFFNKGEEINRVGSFEIARREFIEANPGVKWNTNEGLATIVARADDLSMNMTRVTEGAYQKGLLGIPFQFLQHSIKFGANVIGGVMGRGPLTQGEAFALLAGNMVAFGLPSSAEDYLGDYLNGLSEDQKQYITQGLIAGVVSTIGETLTGERTNLALGTRMGSLDFYDDLFFGAIDLLSGETTRIGSAITGPTGSTIKNALQVGELVGDFWGNDEKSLDTFLTTVNQMGASMVSTWRNIDKAYYAYHANNVLYNKRGDATATITNPELVFQALGFQSTEAAEANMVFRVNQDYQRFIKSRVDDYTRLQGLAWKAYLSGNKEEMFSWQRQADAIVYPLPEGDKQKIWQGVKERTRYDTTLREAVNKWGMEMTSHKNRLMVNNPNEGLNNGN